MLIDVSKYQGDIDWARVKFAGVDEAIIRCYVGGDKGSGVDQKFKQNIEGAIAQGIRVGVYCYSKATTEAGGKAEAQNTAKAIEPYKDKLYFPVFIDLERDGTGAYSKKVISGFCKEINALGYNAGIYCSTGWRQSYLKGVNADYWWIADYRGEQPANCCIWQYSRKGRVDGINANVDLDKNLSYHPQPASAPEPIAYDFEIPTRYLHYVENKIMQGNDVRSVQAIVGANQDGLYGPKTKEAVAAWQAAHGLTVDGKWGEQCWTYAIGTR